MRRLSACLLVKENQCGLEHIKDGFDLLEGLNWSRKRDLDCHGHFKE